MTLSERELEQTYKKWLAGLPKKDRDKLKADGLHKPHFDYEVNRKNSQPTSGMQISGGGQTSEADPKLLACVARDLGEFEPVIGVTPLDEIVEQEEATAHSSAEEFTKVETARIKADAVSALLGYLFSPFNNKIPSPVEVSSKLFLLAYTIRPELIEGWSLERIAKCFDSNRQCFSKRLIKQDSELNLRARNRKGAIAVSLYREGCKEWWAEKRAKERQEKRKDYLAKWRAANAAEVKAYQEQYRAKYRDRLNAVRRQKRGKNQ